MAGIQFDITINTSRFVNDFEKIRNKIESLSDTIKKSGQSLDEFFGDKRTQKALTAKIDLSNPKEELKMFDDQLSELCNHLDSYFTKLKDNMTDALSILNAQGGITADMKDGGGNAKQTDELKRQNAELVELLRKRTEELEKEQRLYRQLSEAVKTGNTTAIRQLAQEADEADKRMRMDSAKRGLADIAAEMDALAKKMAAAEGEMDDYKASWEALQRRRDNGDNSITDAEINEMKGLYQIASDELSKMKTEYNGMAETQKEYKRQLDEAAGSQMGIRAQIVNSREELAKMVAMGKQGTPMFQDAAEEAGKMRREMALANTTMQYFSDPNRHLASLKTGLQGVAGSVGLVNGVIGIFNSNSEKMAQIQTKISSILGIIVGLETTYSTIKKGSNVMLAVSEFQTWALAKARSAEAAATNAGTLATIKHTAAQKAFNFVAKANPYVLLLSVVGALGVGLFSLTKSTEDATEAQERLNRAHDRLREANVKLGASVGDTMAEYMLLKKQWESLSTEQAKNKWIDENKSKFNQMQLAVTDVISAENAFVNNSAAVVNALKARAEAEAWGEIYKERIKKKFENDNDGSVNNGRYRYVYSVGQEMTLSEANRLFGRRMNGTVGSSGYLTFNGSHFGAWEDSDKVVLTAQAAQELNEKAIERQNYLLAEEAKGIQEAEERMVQSQQAAVEAQKAIADLVPHDSGRSGSSKTKAERQQEYYATISKQELADKRKNIDLMLSTREAEIKAMEEGTDKKLAQMKLDKQRELEGIRRSYEDLRVERVEQAKRIWSMDEKNKDRNFYDSDEYKLAVSDDSYTEEQKRNYDARIKAVQEVSDRAFAVFFRAEERSNREAVNEFLRQWGDYAQKRQAITEDSNDRICELEEELARATIDEAREASQARINTVKAETEQQLEELDIQYGKAKAFMTDLFEDASEKSVAEIDSIISKYEALVTFLKGDGSISREQLVTDFGFTETEIDKALEKLNTEGISSIKAITDALKGLKDELAQHSAWRAFNADLSKGVKQIKDANGDLSKIGQGVDNIGKATSDFTPQLRQFSDDVATIFGFDDSKIQDGINALEGMGTTAAGVGQIMSGDIAGGIMNTINGIAKMSDALDGMFGADYSSYETLVEQYDRLAEVWDVLIERKSEYINMSYGAESLKAGHEVLTLIEKQAETYRTLGVARLNAGASGGSHAIGRRLAKGTSSEDWENIAASLGMTVEGAKDFIGSSRMTGLFDLTAEQIKSLQESNQVWWANMDADVRKYLESIIENEERWKATQQQLMEQLTTTTKENVFDDFLNSLYNLADGSENVMDDIAKDWQRMVNRMVINNFVAGTFQDKLNGWYQRLYDVNRRRSEGSIDNNNYQKELDGLRADYDGFLNDAQQQMTQFVDMGIIQPIEDAADVTLITIGTIKDGWKNILMDMSSDTEDWAQDIAKIMTEQLADELIFNEDWEQQQQEWLDRYKEVMEDNSLDQMQKKALLDQLRKEQEEELDTAKRRMKEITDVTGYNGGTRTQEQSASVQAMERITVDQADELIGRMNAGQMIWQQHKDITALILQNLAALQQTVGGSLGRDVADLVGLAVVRNQSLASILETTKGFRNDMLIAMEDLRRDFNVKL